LVTKIKNACEWIAPVTAYPGEFEMEAMATGALRVLNGTEKLKKYHGICRFKGFNFEQA
jgi:butyrate kinase